MLSDVFYGKHILTRPGRDLRRERMAGDLRETPMAPHRRTAGAGRQKNISSLVRLNDVALTA